MAWGKRWEMVFASMEDALYHLEIWDKDWSGGVTELTGGAQPFVTDEDDDGDVFKAVRGQTGYINVVTDDPSLLETLLPKKNTTRQVRLLLNDEVVWLGYMSVDIYTQTWNGGVREISLPVNSVLQTLESVCIHSEMSHSRYPLAKLVSLANELLDGADYAIVENLVNYEDAAESRCWLTWELDFQTFFLSQNDDEESSGDSTIQDINQDDFQYGCTLYEALEKALQSAGLCLQERGRTWYATRADIDYSSCRCVKYSLSDIERIVSGGEVWGVWLSDEESDLLRSVIWRGTDNTVDYENGARSVSVSTEVLSNDELLTLPDSLPNDSEPYRADNITDESGEDVTMFSQPCEGSGGSTEHFWYYHYGEREYIRTASRDEVIAHSVVGSPLGVYWEQLDTGAFHIRYCLRRSPTDAVYLSQSALLLNAQYGRSDAGPVVTRHIVYSLSSGSSVYMRSGWIRINYNIQNFVPFGSNNFKTLSWIIAEYNSMVFTLKVGDMVWNYNSGAWERLLPGATLEEYRFPIFSERGVIRTNKTEDMLLDVSDGFFIPIPEGGLNGVVELSILDECYTFLVGNQAASNHLLTGLEVTHEQLQGMTYSGVSENRYKRHIMQSGFKGSRSIGLSIGTMNNNVQAVNFIRYSNGDYIVGVPYYTGNISSATNRPELHLLDRMWEYYGAVRRRFSGVFLVRDWLPTQRFSYLGRQFMAVLKNRDWQRDTDEVLLIETKG